MLVCPDTPLGVIQDEVGYAFTVSAIPWVLRRPSGAKQGMLPRQPLVPLWTGLWPVSRVHFRDTLYGPISLAR